MQKILLAVAFCFGVCSLSRDIQAQVHTDTLSHKYSFTFSPLHLILPEVFVSFEDKLKDRMSVGAFAGIGNYEGYDILEIGGRWSPYIIGNFEHGLPIIVELGYVSIVGNDANNPNVHGSGKAIYVGPMVGYKYISDYGLTLNLAAGVQIFTGSANAENSSTGQNAGLQLSGMGGVIRALIGWSF